MPSRANSAEVACMVAFDGTLGPPAGAPGGTPATIDLAVASMHAIDGFTTHAAAAIGEMEPWLSGHGYDPVGALPLRDAVAARLSRRGLATSADQVVVTSGAMHALNIILRVTLRPGDGVLVESATYPTALDALRTAGARVTTFGIDRQGWDVDVLASGLARSQPRLVYVIPDFHNPTGTVVPDHQRRALVESAARSDSRVVVDESFVELRLDGDELPSPVAAFDGEGRVLTIGSASKAFWGGLRVGWIRTTPMLAKRIAQARAQQDMASPVVDQLIVARLLTHADALLPARREVLRQRRDLLAALMRDRLPGWSFELPRGGMSLWVRLPGMSSSRIAAAAMGLGLRLAPGPRFSADAMLEGHLRLPFVLPGESMARGVDRLARAAEGASAA